MNILTINLALSTLVFWIAARLYVLPKLQDYEARTILLPILLLHSLRHLGLMSDSKRTSQLAILGTKVVALAPLARGRMGDNFDAKSANLWRGP